MHRLAVLCAVGLAASLGAAAPAAAAWRPDSGRGDQVIPVPCPDGTTARVTLQAAQLEYDRSFPVPLTLAQRVRAGVFQAPGGCATETRFEVISPPGVENFAETERIGCELGGAGGPCDPGFDTAPGNFGGSFVLLTSDDAPARWFPVPQTTPDRPLRLSVPMIPSRVYKTFGMPEAVCGTGPCRPAQTQGRPVVVAEVRAAGTTTTGGSAWTSVGLWTAGGSAAPVVHTPKRIRRAALAGGRVRIRVEGPEASRVRLTVRVRGRVVARGTGRLPASGRLRIRLRPTRPLPATARSADVDWEVAGQSSGDRVRLT